jgi:hypothetical protein
MTPESIPGRLIPEELEEELSETLVYHHGPAYLEHEVFLTDLPEAA